LLHFFGLDQKFLGLLDDAKAVISGSAALAVINGWTHTPRDLDIYVSSWSLQTLLERLLDEYDMIYVREPRAPGDRYDRISSAIVSIHTLRFGRFTIDVMEAKHTSMEPIFLFHSSVVMNAITAYSVFSAYPYLTSTMRNVVNSAIIPKKDPIKKEREARFL
ncbi:hypothetical protein H0H93_009472, partial [Arthromyces matolae]